MGGFVRLKRGGLVHVGVRRVVHLGVGAGSGDENSPVPGMG